MYHPENTVNLKQEYKLKTLKNEVLPRTNQVLN